MAHSHEMSTLHREILRKERPYLIRNVAVDEELLSHLFADEVLSDGMIDEIKASSTKNGMICGLLDLLPRRGPNAFDILCDGLLKCDHAHVAEHLKILETTAKFEEEIQRQEIPDGIKQELVCHFKDAMPDLKDFFRQQLEMFTEQEEKHGQLEEADQLRSNLTLCRQITEHLAQGMKVDGFSIKLVKQQKDYIRNIRQTQRNSAGYDEVERLLAYMEEIWGCLDVPLVYFSNMESTERSVADRIDMIMNQMKQDADLLGKTSFVSGFEMQFELENILRVVSTIAADVQEMARICEQKQECDGEILSMFHHFQEIRRLHSEILEKRGHITQLKKRKNTMSKKVLTSNNRKHVKSIECSIYEMEQQTAKLHSSLENHSREGDEKLHILLQILPNCQENDFEYLRMATDVSSLKPLGKERSHSSITMTTSETLNTTPYKQSDEGEDFYFQVSDSSPLESRSEKMLDGSATACAPTNKQPPKISVTQVSQSPENEANGIQKRDKCTKTKVAQPGAREKQVTKQTPRIFTPGKDTSGIGVSNQETNPNPGLPTVLKPSPITVPDSRDLHNDRGQHSDTPHKFPEKANMGLPPVKSSGGTCGNEKPFHVSSVSGERNKQSVTHEKKDSKKNKLKCSFSFKKSKATFRQKWRKCKPLHGDQCSGNCDAKCNSKELVIDSTRRDSNTCNREIRKQPENPVSVEETFYKLKASKNGLSVTESEGPKTARNNNSLATLAPRK